MNEVPASGCIDGQRTAVGFRDDSRGKQIEARRVRRRARRDKRLEKVVRAVLCELRTAVGHAHDSPFVGPFPCHFDTPTRAGQCVLGIDEQIQNGLLQLCARSPCTETRRAVGSELNGEPRPGCGKPPQVDRDPGELTEIDVDALPDRRLRKRGNLRDCCRHAVALGAEAFQRPAGGLGQSVRPSSSSTVPVMTRSALLTSCTTPDSSRAVVTARLKATSASGVQLP